jgi:hypothetical protein
MNKYECIKCKQVFTTNFSLERHTNKKVPCTFITKYQCKICSKYFKRNESLKEHTIKSSCKIIFKSNNQVESNKEYLNVNTSTGIENDIRTILISKIDSTDKIFYLKKLGINSDDIELNKILTTDVPIDLKIKILKNSIKGPATIINNTNNTTTTNNIQFNNFGNENIDYLTEKFFKKLLTNNYGENIFLKLSDEIYLNQKHPENQTIKIDNLNNKFCKVKEKNKWITTTKEEALKKIFNRAVEIVNNCLAENEDIISDEKINIINGYIEKDFEDELIVDAVKKLALNIYNFYNSSMI